MPTAWTESLPKCSERRNSASEPLGERIDVCAVVADRQPSFANIALVEFRLSLLYGSYNGTTGFSLAYSLATALFGGLTPLLSTWLIAVSGNKAAPGIGLAGAGAISLVATYLVYRGIVRERDPDRKKKECTSDIACCF